MKILLLPLLAFACAAHALATTYQVGPGRSYATLQSVSNRLHAGDVVEVDGGVTYAGQITFRNHGTAELPVVVRGVRAAGARPVLSTSGGVAGGSVVRFWAHHYVFEGFDVTGALDPLTTRGLHVVADDVTIRDCVVREVVGQGIHGSDSAGSLTLDRVEVHHCGTGGLSHQIYAATDNAAYPAAKFRMQGCYIHDGAGGNNVKSRAGRNEIFYNWIEGAKYHELDLIGADPTAQDAGTAGSVREDADVVGNVFLKKATSAGSIARLGTDGLGAAWARYRFVGNTFLVEAAVPGTPNLIRIDDAVQSLEMHNNVFDHAGGPLRVVLGVSHISNSGTGSAGANNWVPRGATGIPPTWTGTITGGAPGFRDAAAWDLTPSATGALFNGGAFPTASPAGYAFPSPLAAPLFHPSVRAAGMSPRPADGAMDIGAFEFAAPPRANFAPVAVDDLFLITATTAATIDVLANDTDADGDALAVTSVTPSPFADVTVSGNRVVFTPRLDFPGEAVVTYRISDGLATATATLTVRNPFLLARGSYDGLISDAAVRGYIKLNVKSTGSFSGSVRVNGRRSTVRGAFDFNGGAIVSLVQTDGSTLVLALQLGDGEITGSVNGGAEFTAVRAPFGKGNPAPQAGAYTMLLPEPAARGAFPPGSGFALMKVSSSGAVRIGGRLGDGTAFGVTANMRADGTLPFYAGLYAPVKGGVFGTLTFRAQAGVSDCDGALEWWKPVEPSGNFREGFALTLPAIGARTAAPAWTGAHITLGAGGLASPLTHALAVSPVGAVTVLDPGADALVLAFVPTTGLFTGTFTHPVSGAAMSFRGVFYAPKNIASGVFYGHGLPGFVDVIAP